MYAKNLKLIALIWMILSALACSPGRVDTKPIPEIRFDSIINEPLSLSSYVDSVDYIVLNTEDKVLLSNKLVIKSIEDALLIHDKKTEKLHLFDTRGQYIRQISNKGNGPEEYRSLQDARYDQDRQWILLLDQLGKKIMCYDLDGMLIRQVKLNHVFQSVMPLGDDKLHLFIAPYLQPASLDPSVINAQVIDYDGKEIHRATMTIPYEIASWSIYFGAHTYWYQDTLCIFPHTSIDTAYYLDKNFQLVPRYAMDYPGKPDKYAGDFDGKTYLLGMHAPGLSIGKPPFEFTNCFLTSHAYMDLQPLALLKDKNDNKTYNVRLDPTRLAAGLLDDLDGGPIFWPSEQLNERIGVQYISNKSLLSYLKAIESKPQGDHQLSDKLKKIGGLLDEEGDMILRLAYFKDK